MMMICSGATVSPGFTTGLGLLGHYTGDHLTSLYTRVLEAGVTAPVTVPIRASLGARSVTEIKAWADILSNTCGVEKLELKLT